MATQLQIRRGTSTQVAAFTGAEGEIVVNTTNDSVHVNDGSTAGGFELARADFNNISASATLTIGTLNTTNLDLTNLEVTNIKAKDGTAAGSIADSTGVMTIASSVLTTTDINGGTADSLVIGASTPAAGSFTTFTSNGIDDNANATAVTINSDEDVLIGTATRSADTQVFTKSLTVKGTYDGTLELETGRSDGDNSGVGRMVFVMPTNNASARDVAQIASETDGSTANERGGSLIFSTKADNVDGVVQRLNINSGGDISFYDGSGNAGFFWDSSAAALGIGTSLPSRALEVSTDGTAQFRLSRVDSTINANNTIGSIEFSGTDDTSGIVGATIVATAGATWGGGSYPTDLRFSTMTGSTLSEAARFDSSGDFILAANATGAALIKGVSGDQTDRNSGGYPQYTFVGNEGTGIRRPSANVLAFDTGGAEAARFDSSQNFVLGGTNSRPAEFSHPKGISFRGDIGQIQASTDGNIPIVINRDSSDGDLIYMLREGSVVGSIGSNSGYMVIGSPAGADAHLLIGNNLIHPATSTGGVKDNAIDIGGSSNRFKDLYLSGGAYLGGTAAANKLDDYEEGAHTCTVTMGSGSCSLYSSYNKIKYTKIGNLVTIQGQIRVESVSSPSGEMRVSMPFSINTTEDEGSNISGSLVRTYLGNAPTGGLFLHGTMVFNQGDKCNLQWSKSGSATVNHVPTAGEYLIFNFSYNVA